MQIRAAAPAGRQHTAAAVGQQAHAFGPADVDAQDVHACFDNAQCSVNNARLSTRAAEMTAVDRARQVLASAIGSRVFPAAAVEAGTSAGPLWQDAVGALTFAPDSSPARLETPFDLASLTKVIATTTVMMELVEKRAVGLDEPLTSIFPEWRGADRERVTVRDLLEHASGLPPRLLDAPPSS